MLNLFNVESFTVVVIWMVIVLSNASESVITGELKWTCVSVPSQRCVWWGRGGRVVQRAAGSQRGSGVCWLTLERNLTNTHTHTWLTVWHTERLRWVCMNRLPVMRGAGVPGWTGRVCLSRSMSLWWSVILRRSCRSHQQSYTAMRNYIIYH